MTYGLVRWSRGSSPPQPHVRAPPSKARDGGRMSRVHTRIRLRPYFSSPAALGAARRGTR